MHHILDRLGKLANKEFLVAVAVPEEEYERMCTALPKGTEVIPGDTFNVLQRYEEAARGLEDYDFLVRLTGDNPFPDLGTMEMCIAHAKGGGSDYFYPLGLPLGMGFEFVRVGVLRSLKFQSLEPHHLEHVTIFFRENTHLYDIAPLEIGPFVDKESGKFYRPEIRLTVDEQVDLDFARKVFDHFQKINLPYFGARDIAALYAHYPEFFSDNLHITQRKATSIDERAQENSKNLRSKN